MVSDMYVNWNVSGTSFYSQNPLLKWVVHFCVAPASGISNSLQKATQTGYGLWANQYLEVGGFDSHFCHDGFCMLIKSIEMKNLETGKRAYQRLDNDGAVE